MIHRPFNKCDFDTDDFYNYKNVKSITIDNIQMYMVSDVLKQLYSDIPITKSIYHFEKFLDNEQTVKLMKMLSSKKNITKGHQWHVRNVVEYLPIDFDDGSISSMINETCLVCEELLTAFLLYADINFAYSLYTKLKDGRLVLYI